MNNFERVRDLVNEYVAEHGTDTEMTRGEFLEWVHETYENISAAKNNLYPTDISYNLYNAGLKDFPGLCLCLVYVEERDTFRLVGTDYKYTGPIWQYKGKSNEQVVGQWSNGICNMGTQEVTDLPEGIILRRDDLKEGVAFELSSIPVTVSTKERNVLVNFQELLICGISVEDEGYWIFNASSEWADKTTYLCEEDANGTWKYYLETIDECIGESKRLVMFEAQKGKSTGKPGNVNNGTHTSELSKILDDKTFENTFAGFIAQADKNAISGKGEGGQTPVGFSAKPSCDGADISTHYGQGGASKTPYLNWWVVSIYYTPDNGNIMMGIEETRYPHLKEMQIKPLRYAQIGNKKVDVAIFYSATKSSINYSELREGFMNVCEEVMRLGLK